MGAIRLLSPQKQLLYRMHHACVLAAYELLGATYLLVIGLLWVSDGPN